MTPYDCPSQKGIFPSVSMIMWHVSPVAFGPTILSTDLILALNGFLGLKVLRGNSISSSLAGILAFSSTVTGTDADVSAARETSLEADLAHRLLATGALKVCDERSYFSHIIRWISVSDQALQSNNETLGVTQSTPWDLSSFDNLQVLKLLWRRAVPVWMLFALPVQCRLKAIPA